MVKINVSRRFFSIVTLSSVIKNGRKARKNDVTNRKLGITILQGRHYQGRDFTEKLGAPLFHYVIS